MKRQAFPFFIVILQYSNNSFNCCYIHSCVSSVFLYSLGVCVCVCTSCLHCSVSECIAIKSDAGLHYDFYVELPPRDVITEEVENILAQAINEIVKEDLEEDEDNSLTTEGEDERTEDYLIAAEVIEVLDSESDTVDVSHENGDNGVSPVSPAEQNNSLERETEQTVAGEDEQIDYVEVDDQTESDVDVVDENEVEPFEKKEVLSNTLHEETVECDSAPDGKECDSAPDGKVYIQSCSHLH